MADLSSPSFIPKQNPAKTNRRAASRQVYILTVVSYLMIIASLVASAALFGYDRYTQGVLASEIEFLDKEIASFNADDMESVIEFDEKLKSIDTLVDGNVSLRAVLALIEEATIDTVQFNDAAFTRTPSGDISLEAKVTTDSFDSVLFQRDMYEAAKKMASVELKDVTINFATTETSEEGKETTTVTFTALFSVNGSDIPYIPPPLSSTTVPVNNVPNVSSSSASTTTP